ncbi:ABC transporter ATP-binding protein, partial [Nostoc sp. NIES-2111]
ALARALILQPKILLLDEPLAALDRRLRKDMQFELKKLQHELGIAFLCVTHDQEEALAMSDRIVVMNSGHVEQIGTPKEIYQTPKTRFAAGFIGEMNFIKAVATGSGSSTTTYEGTGGLMVKSDTASAPGTSVSLAIRPEHFRISTTRDGHSPTIAGTVIDSSYLGTNTRIEINAAGHNLHVETEGAATVGGAGDAISLEYDPKRVLVLPA